MSATVCVTGGAGFIGSHIADAMLAAHHRVLVIDDLSSGSRENVPEGAELHVHDIRSAEAVALLFVTTRSISSCTMRRRWTFAARWPTLFFDADVNVCGLLNLLEAARTAGTRSLFASTGGAIYGEQSRHPADEIHATHPSPRTAFPSSPADYLFFYHPPSVSTPPACATPTSTAPGRIPTARPAWSRSSSTGCWPASNR